MHLVPPDELRRLRRPGHDIGRRRFLTELGRGTFAVAILGGLAAACSSDDSEDTSPATDLADPSTERSPSTSAPSTTAPATNAPSTAPSDATDQADASATLQWSQVLLGNVSAYVLVRGNEAAVVDTGNPGSAERIGETLATLGVTYEDVRHVVLTHHHPDHIGSLPDVMGRAASAGVYAGEADIPNITSPVTVSAVGDGDDVFGLQVINTPGHTPGSISVLDAGIGLLIAGDALNGNADGTGISGANERFTADMGVAGESVRKLAGLDFDTAAFGHGNPVDVGAGALVDALTDSL
jgi:glyoxylase-like metal-dependent hydrolase (beta-lactamase superfamily II)